MTNAERIQAHNAELRECIEIAETLPEAGSGEAVVEPLVISENGTYTAPEGVDGYSPIMVTVPVPDGYIVPSGELEVTENGTYDVTQYASARVAIPDDVARGIVSRTIESYSDADMTIIGNYAFHSCKSLVSVDLPSCETLQNGAFQACTALAEVIAPNTTAVGTDTFNGCVFSTLDMPLLKSCSGRSFAANKKLIRADFPLLSNIGTSCFANCTALEFVRASPTFINASAFQNCSSLQTLVLLGSTLCSLNNVNVFSGSAIQSGTGYVYVPAALVDEYEAATNWTTYASQIRAIEDYPEITGG